MTKKGLLMERKDRDTIILTLKILFEHNISTIICNKILTENFGIRQRANVYWRQIYTREQMKEHGRNLLRISKLGENNPMKSESARANSSRSHKENPQKHWTTGLTIEEILSHYKKRRTGGRPKGYKHTPESCKLMSQNTKGKKHVVIMTPERSKKASDQMKTNRQNEVFNKKMFASLERSITKPHKIVQEWIKQHTKLNTETNYCFMMGNQGASIDEADVERKIAIFVDGNYWHNYPDLRTWDKCCNTFLENRGWKVLRFWESDIKNNPEKIIRQLQVNR
jgi:very-short-patch-repair endonuclease